jgi:uncharacterized cupredoxin-like copper-binding protein
VIKVRKLASAALATALMAGLAGAASAHGVTHMAAKKDPASKYLKVNAAKKTVTFTVDAGDGTANGGLDFDNTYDGQMTLTVPLNWTVDVVFMNQGGLPHSVVFESTKTPLSSANPTPAFKGAETPSPIAGTAPGSGAKFHFEANKVGKYRFVCAFPGHAVSGMWDNFVVSKTAKTATITVKS